jgi:hypothetical protein
MMNLSMTQKKAVLSGFMFGFYMRFTLHEEKVIFKCECGIELSISPAASSGYASDTWGRLGRVFGFK